VILEGFSDAETGSLGTGVGSDSYGNHSALGVSVGGSLGIYDLLLLDAGNSVVSGTTVNY
jgi:hypothetical protein